MSKSKYERNDFADFTFIPPPPLPEPPKFINIQPLVPDLSICSSNLDPVDFQYQEEIRNKVLSAAERVQRLQPSSEKTKNLNSNSNSNSKSNQEIVAILKSHDEQLKRISAMIEQLLRLNLVQERKAKVSVKTRSVQTMTNTMDLRPSTELEYHLLNQNHNGINKVTRKSPSTDVPPIRRRQESSFDRQSASGFSPTTSSNSNKSNSHLSNNSSTLDEILTDISERVNEILRTSGTRTSHEDLSSSDDQRPVGKSVHSSKMQVKSRSPVKQKMIIDSGNRIPSEETIIINQLASKYL